MQDAVVESKFDQLSIGASEEENVSQRSLTQLLISQKTALVARRFTARAARLFKSAGYTNAQRAPLRVLKTAPDGAWRGDLIMVGATLCMALYNVYARPFIARSSPLGYLAAGMAVGMRSPSTPSRTVSR